MSRLDWKTDSEKMVFETPLFDIFRAERTSESGKKGSFIWLDSPDWVVIIPWKRVNGVPCFIMEEQWRHGSSSVTREFPAGLVERGEASEAAARREFLEETGCIGSFTKLGEVNPNPAFMGNHQSFFFVEDIEKVSEQDLDANEEINVIEVPVEEAVSSMGEGIYGNGIMMGAIGFFLRYAEKRPELRQVL